MGFFLHFKILLSLFSERKRKQKQNKQTKWKKKKPQDQSNKKFPTNKNKTIRKANYNCVIGHGFSLIQKM